MQISIYNISLKIYMQIYMICGKGLCLRVGKKNLYVANEIVRTNPLLFLGGKSSKGKQQLMYLAKRKKNSKMSHQISPF